MGAEEASDSGKVGHPAVGTTKAQVVSQEQATPKLMPTARTSLAALSGRFVAFVVESTSTEHCRS
jgi:hypothetical protein